MDLVMASKIIIMCLLIIPGPLSAQSISKNQESGRVYQPGDLLFSDEFDIFDLEVWTHEKTLGGSSTWEFQMFDNFRDVSYVQDGKLFIKPQLTNELLNGLVVHSGQVSLYGQFPEDTCTNGANFGCERSAAYPLIVNPVISAKVRTINSFYFTYGRVEIRAKMPAGDWMWPQVHLLPRFNAYGSSYSWPINGQFVLLESRGNQLLTDPNTKENIGTKLVTSGLHYGLDWSHDGWDGSHVHQRLPTHEGFDADFHIFECIWTDRNITFSVDGRTTKVIAPPEGGFWERGHMPATNPNPWRSAPNKRMAPFDQKMSISISVAVGGVSNVFEDYFVNGKGAKPWRRFSDRAAAEFYDGKAQWLPSWRGDSAALQIDYIRVYAV